MAATGARRSPGWPSFWPLLLVAFVGTLNPSSGDVSVFLPLEHARLAGRRERPRTDRPVRALQRPARSAPRSARSPPACPTVARSRTPASPLDAMRAMFALYAAIGLVVWALYRSLPAPRSPASRRRRRRSGRRAASSSGWPALFSVDAFAGGLVVNALLALWLFQRFGLSLGAGGCVLLLLPACCQRRVAAGGAASSHARIGLLNTMVFTHIPANLCLVLAPRWRLSCRSRSALLFVRSALSQMDVPTRTAYVMARRDARPSAPPRRASPRCRAASRRRPRRRLPAPAGRGLAGAPLVACGLLKIAYDLALLLAFRGVRLPEGE